MILDFFYIDSQNISFLAEQKIKKPLKMLLEKIEKSWTYLFE